jgi:hypothetical protein
MKRFSLKLSSTAVILAMVLSLSGCAALKKKFTPKKKPKKAPVIYSVRKYDVKPSMDLYEKHYVFWINWHRELISELGENFKSDIRSAQEMRGNLESMKSLLVDEKAAKLAPHVSELKKVEAILKKRNMTKVNETRIRQILGREYRTLRSGFSPTKMTGSIRADWKSSEEQ